MLYACAWGAILHAMSFCVVVADSDAMLAGAYDQAYMAFHSNLMNQLYFPLSTTATATVSPLVETHPLHRLHRFGHVFHACDKNCGGTIIVYGWLWICVFSTDI